MAVPSPSSPPDQPAPDQSAPDKQALRRVARRARREFVAAHGRPWAPGASDFERWFDRGVTYASYRPLGAEADPAAIERIAAGSHDMIRCYPRVDADGAMRFYAPDADGLVVGADGIEVPAPTARPRQPYIVFLPLLAFDRSGTRLGQGGGHYDRALAALADAGAKPIRIGVAWSVQEMPALPRDAWDIPLDAVITEREWIDCTP